MCVCIIPGVPTSCSPSSSPLNITVLVGSAEEEDSGGSFELIDRRGLMTLEEDLLLLGMGAVRDRMVD